MSASGVYQISSIGYEDVSSRHKVSIRQYLNILFIIIMASTISLSILRLRHPDIYQGIVSGADLFGFSKNSDAEKERLARIDLLPISDEKKDFLINHNIYMGVPPHMTVLALGKPRNIQTAINAQTGKEQLVYVYHFDTDSRPTLLIYENDILVAAQKASVDFQYTALAEPNN